MLISHSAVTAGAISPAVASAGPAFVAPPVTADSTPLTEAQVTQYLVLKKALAAYWSSHQDALAAAQAQKLTSLDNSSSQMVVTQIFNYPELVKTDTAIASMFAKHKFTAESFTATQLVTLHAMMALVAVDSNKSAVPADTSLLGKNVAVVKAHRDELKAVGMTGQPNGSVGGIGGMLGSNAVYDIDP